MKNLIIILLREILIPKSSFISVNFLKKISILSWGNMIEEWDWMKVLLQKEMEPELAMELAREPEQTPRLGHK